MKSGRLFTLALAAILAAAIPARGLNIPPTLRDELTGGEISEGTRNLVICIHGWNNPPNPNRYTEYEWAALVAELKIALPKAGSDPWALLLYHWEKDADTGGVFGWPNPYQDNAVANANAAAAFAWSHGDSLGPRLPLSLRRVHIIAHSAGAWAARQTALSVLENNRFVVVQVTLLDPYVPDTVLPHSYNVSKLNDLALADFLYSGRVSLLENYYADDSLIGGWNSAMTPAPTPGTQNTFAWREIDINQRVDWGVIIVAPPGARSPLYQEYYDWHSGPIYFYADTLSAAAGYPAASLPTGSPFNYQQRGWYRSLYYRTQQGQLPRITTQPVGQSSTESPVILSVSASGTGPFTYQWFKNNSLIIGANNSTHTVNSSTDPPTPYVVRVTDDNGNHFFSDRAVVTFYSAPPPPAAPAITSVSPSTLPTSISTQLFNIYGSNFKASGDPNASTLIFRDPANTAYVRTPIFVSSSQLQYNITVQSAVGTWSVTVTNAGQAASNLKMFLVETPPPNTGSLTVNLSPEGAVSAGGQWRVDGGSYRNTGDTATGLTPGSHTVSFKAVSGYTTPPDKSASITSGVNTTDSGTYTVIVNCSYSLSSYGDTWAAAGGSDGFNVIAPSGCAWAATVNVNWVNVTFGASGVGTHGVNYSVDPNFSVSPRTGAITVGGQTFTINQNGNQTACTFSLSEPGVNWPASGGSNSFSLFTQKICDWEATKNVSWISITGGNSGTGNGLIQYTVQPNLTSLSRSGVITVAEQAFSIVQDGVQPPPGTLMTGLHSPQEIYLDGDFIYVMEYGGQVTRVSKTTGTIQPLGTVSGGAKGMALAGNSIYIGSGNGEIDVMPKTGGTPSAIITGDTPERICYYNGRIYFTRFTAGQIASVSTGGGAVTVEGSGTPNAAGLLVDATGIYWAEFDTPRQIFSKVGTTQTPLIGANLGNAGSRGVGLLVRSNILYYCGQGGVYAVPAAGGTPVRLGAYFGGGSALACDGTNLFAVSDTRGGNIIQIALADSTVTTLATNILSATSVLEDQDRVYFTTLGASGNEGTLQWVQKVTPTMDTIAPIVSIGSPIAEAQFNDPTLPVGGIASDDTGVALVELRLNGGSWQAASGTTNWNLSVNLVASNNTIEARSRDSSGNYSTIASVVVTYSPPDTKLPQIITFGALSKQVVGDAPFALSASASSGLPVSFSVLSGPAIMNGNIVTITGAGLAVLRASQSGDATYAPAPNVDQALIIVPGNNVITDVQQVADGMFTFRFYGESEMNYVVQASTNLVNWLPLATNQIGGLGYLEFTDMSSTNYDRRFYRIAP